MIPEFEKYEGDHCYRDEPLFEYLVMCADELCPQTDIDPDTGEGWYSDSIAQDKFAQRYLSGNIDTDFRVKYEKHHEIQDTLRIFHIDKDKFWYLLLFIKDYIEDLTISALTFNDSPRSELDALSILIGEQKAGIDRWQQGNPFPEKKAKLTFKIDGHKNFIIENPTTLAFLKKAIDDITQSIPVGDFAMDCKMGIKAKNETLADGYRLRLFYDYLKKWLMSKTSDPEVKKTLKGVKVSKSRIFLISKLVYVIGWGSSDFDWDPQYLENMIKKVDASKIKTSNRIYW